MISYFLFGLSGLSFIFVVLSLIFIFKMKCLEDKRLKNSVSCLLIGLAFLGIFLFVKTLEVGLRLFNNMEIGFYSRIFEIICLSLMVVFFLVGMLVMKEVK